jgi:hypothetical protein
MTFIYHIWWDKNLADNFCPKWSFVKSIPEEVEERQRHEGRVGVQHVVRVGQDVRCERGLPTIRIM